MNSSNSSSTLGNSRFVESVSNVVKYSPSLVASFFTINVAMEILTIVGNLTVILTVAAFRQLWIPSNILMASLAVADLTIGLILQTSNGINLFKALTNGNRSCVSPSCALMLEVLGVIIITVSLAHLSLITLDRVAAIVYPLRYVTAITMFRTKMAVVLAWTTSFVFGIVATIPSQFSQVGRVLWHLLMLLTCVVMITLYGRLYCISRKHARRIRNEVQTVNPGAETKDERRGLMTAAIVTIAMVTSYVPIVALQLKENAQASGEGEGNDKLVHDVMEQFAILLVLFNSTLNPLVYFFRSWKLRNHSCKLFKSIPRRIQELIS